MYGLRGQIEDEMMRGLACQLLPLSPSSAGCAITHFQAGTGTGSHQSNCLAAWSEASDRRPCSYPVCDLQPSHKGGTDPLLPSHSQQSLKGKENWEGGHKLCEARDSISLVHR